MNYMIVTYNQMEDILIIRDCRDVSFSDWTFFEWCGQHTHGHTLVCIYSLGHWRVLESQGFFQVSLMSSVEYFIFFQRFEAPSHVSSKSFTLFTSFAPTYKNHNKRLKDRIVYAHAWTPNTVSLWRCSLADDNPVYLHWHVVWFAHE